ncbi:MAG: DUF4350 domain-containing protein [Cyanobacteria bacterium HKST-UBA04]|nr:DUF4350 domain-containing protein [Cyanobacteria bacterium HKST-UBA04]
MPLRLWLFVAGLLCFVALTMAAPLVSQQAQMNQATTSVVHPAPSGYKALYELFGQVYGKDRIRFWTHSATRLEAEVGHEPATVWFIEPGEGLFLDGVGYGNRMRSLVEAGHHLVFVLGEASPVSGQPLEKRLSHKTVFDYLQAWFGVTLRFSDEPLATIEGYQSLTTRSTFADRQVAQLAINQDEAPVQADGTQTAARLYGLSGPCYLPTCHKKLWWVAHSDTPLVVSYPLGRGAVTVVGTPFFFKNGQLARKDNAALAVAIQALYPGADRILFDGYSNGFRDKPDFITLMARGSGRSLLLTVIIALGVLCVWVATAPVLRQSVLPTSEGRFYTQERFFEALATHLAETRVGGRRLWGALINKAVQQFLARVKGRYPNSAPDVMVRNLLQVATDTDLAKGDDSAYAREVLALIEAEAQMPHVQATQKQEQRQEQRQRPRHAVPAIATSAQFVAMARALYDLERKVLP